MGLRRRPDLQNAEAVKIFDFLQPQHFEKQDILFMPFMDIEKLHGLNIAFNNNKKSNRKIDIVTQKENKKKIEEILISDINIIELEIHK